MRVLLLDSSRHYPLGPLFLEGLREIASKRSLQWAFFDEGPFLRGVDRYGLVRGIYKVLGGRPPTLWSLNLAFRRMALSFDPDVIIVVKGSYIAPAVLREIRAVTKAILVNYAPDDPFNTASNTSWLVKSIPLYDLYMCPNYAIVDHVFATSCSRAVYMPFAYHPKLHFPESPLNDVENGRVHCDVAFIGGADSERISRMRELVGRLPRLSFRLYGGYWDRDPLLKRFHQGFVSGREFRLAVAGATISLNFVRWSNRGGQLMRTFEIPACGGFMLAEETLEHRELFGAATVPFFKQVDDLTDLIHRFINDDETRHRLASASHDLIVSGKNTYTDRLEQILDLADR